ncbi:MAG TPA: ABC transporter substrate-binding protein/permease [Terriglobia bacterium]|nr:ABC transporter substrate-binding protein/permease [Terriglobia bacterium]
MKVIAYLWIAFLIAAVPAASAQNQELVWAADAEGGAPYTFPDPRNPATIIGFEVDLANALAARMGRTARFVQNQWDGLVPGLERGEYQVVINGLEITPERAERIHFSTPYFYSTLTMTSRLDDLRILRAEDLRGRTVGVLKVTFAEKYVRNLGGVTVRSYDSQVQPYIDLDLGRVDAVVMDTPIALYYATGPRVRNLELASARMSFGIGIRKSDDELLQQINAALDSLRRDGTLRKIYTDWGIYNAATAQTFGDRDPVTNDNAVRYRDYLDAIRTERTFRERLAQYWQYLPLLLLGALVTLEISAASMAVAISLGLFLAVLRVFGPRSLSWLVIGFIEIIRGTPLLIQLFIIFYGLPSLGIRFSPFWAAVVGLGMNYAAYEAENYRAGIQSIPRGQLDAALALGLTRIQTIRKIILPQAVRLVIPPVTNDFIALLKDSSLVSVITMVELTKMYGQLAATNYDYIGIGLLTAAIYFVLGLPIARLSRLLETRLAYMKV